MIPSEKKIKEMILQALHDKAPEQYFELEEAGELDEFAEKRTADMLEAFEETVAPDLMAVARSDLPTLERIQAAESVQRQAWEQTLATWLEFSPSETAEMESFELEEDDYYAIAIAKNCARRFLKHPNITPQQIVGLGNALYALECLPQITLGANTEFSVVYEDGIEDFREMRYIEFRISESEFGISIGGYVYDKSVGSDSFSEPGWSIEVGGYRDTKCELYFLEGKINKYLNLGAKIVVNDESDFEFE